MDFYCKKYDETNKINSKFEQLQSLTQNELQKSIPIKHSIINPVFFDMDEIFNEHVKNHKKVPFILQQKDFNSVFGIEFYPNNNFELQINQSKFHSKKVLLLWIEFFIERGHRFSSIYEKKITTVSNKKTWLLIFILHNQCKRLNWK